MKSTLTTNIDLPPRALTVNLKQTIENELRKRYEGQLIKDIGRIDTIDKIIDISHGITRPIDNFIVFKVIYEAETFMPKAGDCYKAKIKSITDPGVMCSGHNMDIFIPNCNLLNDVDQYKVGLEIQTELLGVRMDNSFITFGKELD